MNRRLKIEAGFLRIQLTTSKFPAKAQKHARPILDHLFVDTTASELSCQNAVGGFGQHHGEYIYLWTERISTLKYPYLWFNYQPFERHCGKFELAGVSSKWFLGFAILGLDSASRPKAKESSWGDLVPPKERKSQKPGCLKQRGWFSRRAIPKDLLRTSESCKSPPLWQEWEIPFVNWLSLW